jgi:hypothetical protein
MARQATRLVQYSLNDVLAMVDRNDSDLEGFESENSSSDEFDFDKIPESDDDRDANGDDQEVQHHEEIAF